jgi:multimeric flavodoxin WrbA
MEPMKYKVLGVSGSPRPVSNTDIMVKEVLKGASDAGHLTTFVKLNDLQIKGCQACGHCREDVNNKCKIIDDGYNLLEMTIDCDVLVFGSPVYMGGISAQAKLYIDRWYSFKDCNRITKLNSDRRVIGVYAQGGKLGKFNRLFETNERLFNSNNFGYLGTIVAPEYTVPANGDEIMNLAYRLGNTL